jgi:hypothetical protein
MSERVCERDQRCGAEGSLVNQARTEDDVFCLGMVHQ